MAKCMPCQFVGQVDEAKHCLGETKDCDCSCTAHTLAEDDVRHTFMALLSAEAHDEPEILSTLVRGMPQSEMAACLIIAVKYVTWMVREAGIDPVQQVQDAALFWQGGESSADASDGGESEAEGEGD